MCPHNRKRLSWVENGKHILQPVSCSHKKTRQYQWPRSWMSSQHPCPLLHASCAPRARAVTVPWSHPAFGSPQSPRARLPARHSCKCGAALKTPRHCLSSFAPVSTTPAPRNLHSRPADKFYGICRNFAPFRTLLYSQAWGQQSKSISGERAQGALTNKHQTSFNFFLFCPFSFVFYPFR